MLPLPWPVAWFALLFILPHHSFFPPVSCPKERFLSVNFLCLSSEVIIQKSNEGVKKVETVFAWRLQPTQ